MRSITKVAPLAALLAVGAIAAGCGSDDNGGGSATASKSEGGGGGGKTVALFLPESKTARYESKDRPDFERKLKELCPECKLIYSNANQDAARQQQQVEAAITQGADVLVLDPVDSASAAAMVNRAKQSNIPVVAYSRPILDADIDYFVSNDNEKVGVMQGQALVDRMKELGKPNGNIVMIDGSPQDSAAGDFKRGAHSVIDKSGLKIAAEYDTPDWSPDKAQQEMEQALTKVGKDKVDGVYAANDGTGGGAIAAMKAAGFAKMPPVTGQDAELAAIQRIVAGEQYMTVYKKITPQAEAAAQVAAALVKGEQVSSSLINGEIDNGQKKVPSIFTEMVVVKRDNVQKDIIDDGFWTKDQICTGPYKKACAEAGIK
jgi:D-xylose transport system substrate-binding protein